MQQRPWNRRKTQKAPVQYDPAGQEKSQFHMELPIKQDIVLKVLFQCAYLDDKNKLCAVISYISAEPICTKISQHFFDEEIITAIATSLFINNPSIVHQQSFHCCSFLTIDVSTRKSD